jgi:hypothetical protein
MSGEPMDPDRLARLRELVDSGALDCLDGADALVRELLADRDRLARVAREARSEVDALLGPEPAEMSPPSVDWLRYMRRRATARRPAAATIVQHLLDEIDRLRGSIS